MLLIVSPNLCLDRILLVRGFAAGRVHRVEQVSTVAGGKGMNVARVALALGVPCTVTGFLAGPAGRAVYRLAMAEGIQVEPLWVSGEGRVCTIVVDPDEGETVLNEPGPLVGPNRIRALEARIRRHAPNARMVVMCGSLPPGAPEDTYARLVAHLPGVPAVVDASGPALRHAARSGPLVLKANRAELESAAGRAFSSLDQVIHAAQGLRNSGAGHVLVTLGREGALLVGDPPVRFRPPPVPRGSTVGAGDSLTAGLCAGLLGGMSLVEAVRWGMAAAASDVGSLLPGRIDPGQLQDLAQAVTTGPPCGAP